MVLLPMIMNADDSGSCGSGLTYTFIEATHTLTISGTGPMDNYSHDSSSSQKSPWYGYRSKIEKIVIEPGVTTIGTSAFFHSVNLTTVSIPNSINRIYNYAFSNCSALESLDLPPNMSFIAQEAFKNCTTLSSVTIRSINMIYLDAFENCHNLQCVNISSLEDWCNISFQSPNSNPLSIADHLYLNGTEITDLAIPNTLTTIGPFTFYSFDGLASISIPNSVTTIGSAAFKYCIGLKTIVVPNSVTTIDYNCFDGCTNISKFVIGSGIKEIRKDCFYSCVSLKDFYCYADNLPKIDNQEFNNTGYYSKATLHVPKASLGLYKGTEPWKNFYRIIPVEDYTLTYMVDGNMYKTYSIKEGETIVPEPAPEKEGYSFSGWSEIPEIMPAHDVTVIGSFTVNKYKLTYVVDGQTYKTCEVEYGATITPEPAPTKDGYTFSGWSEIPATMPAHDVTVSGTFTINKYKLTYFVDGAEYKSYELEYGATITPESAPTKVGHTFSGWSEIPATMPAHDVTVTGSFSINTYKLTYLINDEEFKVYNLVYGTTITPEAEPMKEGYTFSGWSEIPATMPAHDVTVTGSFTINKYKLTYIVDGQTYKTYEMEFGTAITPEPAPTKEGYTFSGWSEIPATMPAHDVTVTGSFTINKYKLTYIVDGQTYKTYEMEFGTAITPESAPTKEGYTFSGWSEIPATIPAHDVTVTGTFTVNKYKLTYVVDGETYKTYDVEFGAAITPEAEPIKEGHTFSGWSEIPTSMPAHDVTVTGTFTVNKYKLTYSVDGETYKTYDVEFGAVITPEAAPIKEGYTFSGWSEIPTSMPAHDVTVTGSFTVNKYKLTYIVDGETYKTYDVEFGAAIAPEPEPTKEGYTFSGWSEIPTSMPAHDVTVTGTFTVNKYKLTYIVDGETYKTYDVEFGAAITPEAAPTKEGYTFSGWSEIPATMPAYDVTVTGTFTKGSYKLIYVVDGEVYKTIGYDFGDVITPEPEPTRVGYTFSGWSEIPATMPAHDVTVTGTFTVNKYKLTYVVDGQTYKMYEMEYGTTITPEPAPTKEGYTFSGWSEIPATMPAHDVTVTGTFTVNKYKLAYVVDGQTYKTYEVEFGAAIVPEPAPAKEGYTFSGWSNIPATMPAHDVTVTGTFTVNKYKLTYVVDGQTYKTYDLNYGTTITPEPAPSKEGYTFSGWSEIPATMPAHDVTVTGSFTKGSYKLTYMVDGEVYKTVGYDYGDVITPEPVPVKEGYTFSGWNNLPATMPAHDVTVTGTFTVNKYQLTYIVDGEEYKTYEVEYGATITPEPEPVKEGHIFSGWNGLPEVMPAHAVVVTGTFTKAKYMLTYMLNGEVYKSMELEFGAEITPEPPIELEGHTFSGWSSIPATMPAHDVTITATLTVNKYILTYILDGKEYKTMEVEYGTPITPEPDPEKEGYTFSGWSEIPATMPAKLVIVTGTFSINSYMLTYMIGDEVYKQVTYEYGATITPEPKPEGDYVSFEWVGVPETMPAHDVTVTAVYETGIAEIVMMAQQGQVRIYSPNGKMQNKLQKGLNIVVMQDGTTKKVVVK